MKKIIVYAMAIASIAAVSCNKIENEAPVTSEGKYSITATIDNSDTKTAYDADGKFSWVAGDQIKVMVYSQSDANKTANFYRFNADEDGTTVSFTCTGTPDWTAYARTGYAVYPSDLALGGTEGAYTVTLPDSYTITGSDFLSALKVPMIGTQVDTDKYSFKTAVGLLKVTLTNVPVAARKLVLKTSDKLAGAFTLDAENGLLMSTGAADATSVITINFPQQTAGSTINVFVPVPVGTISAGATFEVQQSNGTVIKATPATAKAITIERNHVLPLPAISVEDWVSLGTGKFMDDHGFYYLGASGRSADDYASVTVEKHSTEAGRYRISAPYTSCPSAATVLPNAAAYLYIDVISGEVVANHAYKYNNDKIMFDAPYWGYDALYHNSRIIKYASDGTTPANIQLAPYYYAFNGDYTQANCAQNPKIEIVFPGSTPMLAGTFNYANGASATYDSGSINVNISNSYITAVKVVAAASVAAGVTALESDGSDIYSFTATDSQTATLTDGEYYLVYKVETDGHGFTYKYSDKFEVTSLPEISLSASMITVSTDATYGGGTPYDGGTYTALVDGNLNTFWHTAYESQSGDDYDWANLDSTYGAYIDIALSSPILKFKLQYTTRHNNSNGSPRAILFAVSNDGTTWTTVDTIEEDYMNVGSGQTITLPILQASSSFSYLRIAILKSGPTPSILTTPKGGSTAIAEIRLFGQNS